MERHFDRQIEKLKTRIIKMCSLVDEQVEFAIRSMEELNHELANIVVERDKKVDKFDIKIDRICQKLFALNQPVAMDLRLIMSALSINHNLERMGDLTVNIARHSREMNEKPQYYDRIGFKEISEVCREMVKSSIDSFIDNDPRLAEKVIGEDNKLDNLVLKYSGELVKIMKESPDYIDSAIKYFMTYQDLERLGDHATNISEEVYFIVEAQTVKHRFEGYLLDIEKEKEEESESQSDN